MGGTPDADWVREAVAAHEAALLRYARRLVGEPERARDVVQDTFLRLCREDRASLDGHLREWLFTVCRHRAMDVHRKERRMRQPDTTLPDPATAPEADPSARLARRETTHRALALLATLPERQQEVLRLRFQEGLSYREIAGVQQLTVSHVGVLIHNAMKTLRARLADARPA